MCQDHDDRDAKHPNHIDGVKWFEAVKPCQCGTMPEVWRTYTEVPGTVKKYSVRCPACDYLMTAKSRNRAIRRWNESQGEAERRAGLRRAGP